MKDKITVAFSENLTDKERELFVKADIILIGHKVFNTVNYKQELNGSADKLVKMGAFSKNYKAPCLFAIKTDNYGILKRSVAIFEGGKLISIADANLADKEEGESPSFGYKVTKTSVGKIGVAVFKDVKNVDCIKSLCLCESELIINLYADIYDFNMQNLVSTLSYIFGIPLISYGRAGVCACEATGKVAFKSDLKSGVFTVSKKRTPTEYLSKTFFSV